MPCGLAVHSQTDRQAIIYFISIDLWKQWAVGSNEPVYWEVHNPLAGTVKVRITKDWLNSTFKLFCYHL